MKQLFQVNVMRDNGTYEAVTVLAADKEGEPAMNVAVKHLLAQNASQAPGVKHIQQVQLLGTVQLDATV